MLLSETSPQKLPGLSAAAAQLTIHCVYLFVKEGYSSLSRDNSVGTTLTLCDL